MQQEPRQVTVEGFGIPARGEVAVLESPVGNGAADAVNDLPDALFPLGSIRFAEEILAGNDIDSKLAPRIGEFAIILFKKDGAAIPFDGSGAGGPFDGIKGIAGIFGTERGVHSETFRGNISIERLGVYGRNSIQTNGIHNKWVIHNKRGVMLGGKSSPCGRRRESIQYPYSVI